MKNNNIRPESGAILSATPEFIERRIYVIRSKKVMLDSDLAELYQIETKVLNQAVRRNISRFPEDFMFQVSSIELASLNRSQIVTGWQRHRDPRFRPHVFTELGIAMLSSVLRSDRAVQMNIYIMRTFVKLREMLATHKDLAEKTHGKDIYMITIALNSLLKEKRKLPSAIGFRVG